MVNFGVPRIVNLKLQLIVNAVYTQYVYTALE